MSLNSYICAVDSSPLSFLAASANIHPQVLQDMLDDDEVFPDVESLLRCLRDRNVATATDEVDSFFGPEMAKWPEFLFTFYLESDCGDCPAGCVHISENAQQSQKNWSFA